MRLSIVAALLFTTALALPAAAQDMRGKLQEEIRMQHERAHELQAYGQSDERMAQEFNNQAQQLEQHANMLDGRAREFRTMANAQMFNPHAREQMMKFAEEMDNYARSDRNNVAFRRRMANEMTNSARGAYDSARDHEARAQRIQEFLNSLNSQPPNNNPW